MSIWRGLAYRKSSSKWLNIMISYSHLCQLVLHFHHISREIEARLEKQKATQRYIEEFKAKREEVSMGSL